MTHEIRTRTELFQLFNGPQPGSLNMKELINSVNLRLGADTLDTVTDFEVTEIGTHVDAVLVLGLNAPGDGEHAVYKRVANEPAHENKAQSLDGAWWARVGGVGPTTNATDLITGTLADARLSSAVQTSLNLADTATQPSDLASIATSGSASDLIIGTVAIERLTLASQSEAVAGAINNKLMTPLRVKDYVDIATSTGLHVLEAADVATTTNITLSGEQTIDGVLTSTNRVLVKNQTAPAENGVYVSGAGAWARTADADTWDKLTGALLLISGGTTHGGEQWSSQSEAGGTLNTTDISWAQFSQATAFSASGGVELIGSDFSLTDAAEASLALADSAAQPAQNETLTGRWTFPSLILDDSLIMPTRTAAEAATIAGGVNTVQTQGRLTLGDGAARYDRFASEPDLPSRAKFQSADGAWWGLIETVVTPEMFVESTDAGDDALSLSAMRDYVLAAPTSGIHASRERGMALKPFKNYSITTGINWTGLTHSNIVVEGNGAVIDGITTGIVMLDMVGSHYVTIRDVMLRANKSTPPKIGIQVGRENIDVWRGGFLFENVSVMGYFSQAAYINSNAESSTHKRCQFRNRMLTRDSYAVWIDGINSADMDTAFELPENVTWRGLHLSGQSGGVWTNNTTVTGATSGATGNIRGKDDDQLYIALDQVSGTFVDGETINSSNGRSATIVRTTAWAREVGHGTTQNEIQFMDNCSIMKMDSLNLQKGTGYALRITGGVEIYAIAHMTITNSYINTNDAASILVTGTLYNCYFDTHIESGRAVSQTPTTVMTLLNQSGTFTAGETITGLTSGITATFVEYLGTDPTSSPKTAVIEVENGTGKFALDEMVNGGTSGANGKVDSGYGPRYVFEITDTAELTWNQFYFSDHNPHCYQALIYKSGGTFMTFTNSEIRITAMHRDAPIFARATGPDTGSTIIKFHGRILAGSGMNAADPGTSVALRDLSNLRRLDGEWHIDALRSELTLPPSGDYRIVTAAETDNGPSRSEWVGSGVVNTYGFSGNVFTVTVSAIALTKYSQRIIVDLASGPSTISLPAANAMGASRSQHIEIWRTGSGADVWLAASGSDTINGGSSYRIDRDSIVYVISDGASNWYARTMHSGERNTGWGAHTGTADKATVWNADSSNLADTRKFIKAMYDAMVAQRLISS